MSKTEPRRFKGVKSGHDAAVFEATTKRTVSLVGKGRSAYLWIGNGEKPSWCYATMCGAVTLRKFARAILDEVGE